MNHDTPGTLVPGDTTDMNTQALMQQIDALLARLKAGDSSVIPAIVDAYNTRSVPVGTDLVQGWTVVCR